jgi:hypothetical protein
MPYSAHYKVTREMQDASISQFYYRVLLRPKLAGIITIFIFLIAMIALDPPFKPYVVGFFSAAFLLIVASWVKVYFQLRAQARTGLRLMEHPEVEIRMDEQAIEYISSTGTRRHSWEKIQRLEHTKDFVILMNEKLPLFSLPKSCFSGEMLEFLKQKAQPSATDNAVARSKHAR